MANQKLQPCCYANFGRGEFTVLLPHTTSEHNRERIIAWWVTARRKSLATNQLAGIPWSGCVVT
eukprot:scaffold233330_cov13-Tisochrysis_lutea.AAC.1